MNNYLLILQEYIKDNFKNVTQFCKSFDVHQGNLSSALNGKRKFDIVAAKAIEDRIFAKTGKRIFSTITETPSPKMATIKLYNVKACAGDGRECFVEDTTSPIGLPWKILTRLGLKPEDVYAVEVDGLSMMPTYCPEDYIFIAKTEEMKKIRNYDPYLVKYDNELMIKRLEKIGDVVTLKSDNPDKNRHPDREVKAGIQFDVMGKIIKKLGE